MAKRSARGVASRRIVIDASIAKAAGSDNASNPVAIFCSKFLTAVLRVCHRAVLTDALAVEWSNNQSKFARAWRRQMMSRRKIEEPTVGENATLRQGIRNAAGDDSVAEILEKDCHLIEAALATDQCVASLDDRARHHFHHVAAKVRQLRKVHWVNPAPPSPQAGSSTEHAIPWLEAGAPNDKTQCLGYASSNPAL
jgi:hypothetical protein